MTVYYAYLIFLVVAAIAFAALRPRRAALLTFFGGWLLLPVGTFPPREDIFNAFPYWITGAAVPSQMLVTKAWVVPLVVLFGAFVRDWPRIARFRPAPADAVMLAWCLWPLLSGYLSAEPRPAPWIASLYVAGAWGANWLVGRLIFSDERGRSRLLRAMGLSACACLPIAVAEGLGGPALYDMVYGPHPFRMDGADRYIGYRPLGFFENGNQYGIWVALCALAGLWYFTARREEKRPPWLAPATAIGAGVAIASQSAGAVVLLLAGLIVLQFYTARVVRLAALGIAGALLIGGMVYVSGVIPLRQIAKQTEIGRTVVGGLRAVGRGSLSWRVARDVETLETVRAAPVFGTGQWDWWRPYANRPWGLAILIAGQFGLVGMILAFGSILFPAVRAFAVTRFSSIRSAAAAPVVLALIIVLALVDALMNSFFFFPAIVAAGAIAASPQSGRSRSRASRPFQNRSASA